MNTYHDGKRLRVIIYCRISDDREGRGAGVARQEKDCRARAERNGWDVVAVFVENDLSAYSGKKRPKYEQMLGMLRAGMADAVLALTPKRLYRRIGDAFDFFDLITEQGIHVETIKQGRYDLTTAEGRRDARRAAIDGQYESEEIGERVRDAKAQTAAEGGYRGGPRPFGYEADGVTIRESEARHLREAAEAVLAGASIRSIAREWQEAGVRTVPRRYRQEDGTRGEPRSREWSPSELRTLLLRHRNAGLLSHHGTEVRAAAWPAIIPEPVWRGVVAKLKDPTRLTAVSNARRWLGSGLFRCGHLVGEAECGLPLRCSTSGMGAGHKHVAAYRCSSGAHVTRRAQPLDDYIKAVVVARLVRKDAVHLLAQRQDDPVDLQAADAELGAAQQRLKELAEMFGDGDMSKAEYQAAAAKARERKRRAEELLSLASVTNPLVGLIGAEDVGAEWEGIDLSRRRAVVDALFDVWVLPARRGRLPKGVELDVERIDIRWKQG
ncbi:recombinase family protein [Streptomyces erythrochromogenes]|uniref:recombinase family protein n=1 Tax=Streptomyces erythrochromogenes TaxID=285574 RepID=UPI002257B159|nr:recombinase family protein [Streptomyces erythrochromogenes]MCX5587616.1 recombinase family protein [Streptomyces erythrochromogenes]